MLHFFRKYQRLIFTLAGGAIVLSFSFFGIEQALMGMGRKKATRESFFVAIDGSKGKKSDIEAIGRFIATDKADLQMEPCGRLPNLFNHGVLREDFLKTQLGHILVDRHFKEIEEEFGERLKRHSFFTPYVHPETPAISLRGAWGQILPQEGKKLDSLLRGGLPVDPNSFSLLVDLYLAQARFPPVFLRHYLTLQQNRLHGIRPDPALSSIDLNLFSAWTFDEWFGKKALRLFSYLIYNGAILAEERGYLVSQDEARFELLSNGYEALRTQNPSKEWTSQELDALWARQLSYLDLTEEAAVAIWRRVMLVRRLFQDCGGAVVSDLAFYRLFHNYASQKARVDLYRLPTALRIESFEVLTHLLYYASLVGESTDQTTGLPHTFCGVRALKRRAPEVVRRRFLVEVAMLKKSDLAQNVSLKEMWEWQLDQKNFELLQTQFPQLTLGEEPGCDAGFFALEALEPQLRHKVDHYSRMQIVEQHPEWIDEGLAVAQPLKKRIHVTASGLQFGLERVCDGAALGGYLELSPLKGEVTADLQKLHARERLASYSEDGQAYYRIDLLDRDVEESVFTFEELTQFSLLSPMVDRFLEAKYEEMQEKEQYADLFREDGTLWKPFESVKNRVAAFVYAEVLAPLALSVEENLDQLGPLYLAHYFHRYMQAGRESIEQGGLDSPYLIKEGLSSSHSDERLPPLLPLETQWQLTLEPLTYQSGQDSPFLNASVFEMEEGEWSSVRPTKGREWYFFQLRVKEHPTEGELRQEVEQGRELLSWEASRQLMEEIVETLDRRGGISAEEDA